MPQFGRVARSSLVPVLLALLAACGRSQDAQIAASAAPVRHVVAALLAHGALQPGRCLCVGHFREDAVEDFPAGVLDGEFSKHRWLRKWSECEPYYGRIKKFKGCEGGMTDFICSVSDRTDLPRGTVRVICHVNGESEALQREGYLQDEYDVSEQGGGYSVRPVSLKASGKIHE